MRLGRHEQDIVEREALACELLLELEELLDPTQCKLSQLTIKPNSEP